MNRYTTFILKHRKMIILIFVIAAIICAGLSTQVGVNYNFKRSMISRFQI